MLSVYNVFPMINLIFSTFPLCQLGTFYTVRIKVGAKRSVIVEQRKQTTLGENNHVYSVSSLIFWREETSISGFLLSNWVFPSLSLREFNTTERTVGCARNVCKVHQNEPLMKKNNDWENDVSKKRHRSFSLPNPESQLLACIF